MFQLILGRSGSGKSRMILERAVEAARAGQRVLLLVPEQSSFQTERRVLSMVAGRSNRNITVFSFSRLAESIFRQYGGLAGRRLTDTARLVLMKLAVRETADTLTLYGRQSRRTDFLEMMLQTVDELKSSGTYPLQLRETLRGLGDSQLGVKLADITSVYETYQGIVERDYQDPLDDISRAAGLVRGGDFFAGQAVFVDGFSFFSPPERDLIELMLEQSDGVTLALTADGLSDNGELDIFHDQKSAAHRFIQRCAQVQVVCKQPIVLTQNHRAATPALHAVEEFLSLGHCTPPADSDGIAIVAATDKYDEVRRTAAEINRLVRDCGYRYREIAVVCRNLADYETALESIFSAYAIPLFFDRKEPAATRPILVIAAAALDAARGEWKTEAILRIARCPASGIAMEQAARLENYVYIWSISGNGWEQPFTGSPQGLDPAPEQNDRAELDALEALRLRLLVPLIRLKKSLKNCTGSCFALGIYRYLQDLEAVDNLRAHCLRTAQTEQDPAAQAELAETDTLYNALMEILDLFSDAMGETGLPTADFVEMFELALSSVELGHIPNTNDQTVAGSADRVRLDSPRAVFALGVNEGVFPARYQPYGVFSDDEREQLVQRGVELSASRFQRALLERFFLYSALCAPTERLWLSHCAVTLGGDRLEPSLVVGQLTGLLPASVAAPPPYQTYVADLFTAREQYVRMRGTGLDAVDLGAALAEEGDSRFLELAARLWSDQPAAGIQPETAEALLGRDLNLSPTRIESFYRCPYLYFCDSMLRLRKRKRVEYTPLESGTAIHYVLEQLLRELDGRSLCALSDRELEDRISVLLRAFLERVTADTDLLASRFKYQFQRLTSVLLLLVRHIGEDLSQSLFATAGVEVTVARDGDVKPMTFTAENGTTITVNGKIDRVDLYLDGADRYARVVDYKSGGKDFRLEDVFYGLNMQMLLYLFAVCADKDSPFGAVQPAGILYMPGKVSPVELPPAADRALLRSLIDDTLQMKGLLLEDEKVLRAMERELEGHYIPAKVTRTGTLSATSRVKSAAEFRRIEQLVAERVTQLGDALTSGHIEPLPARGKGLNPCDYCDYGVLCANKNTPCCRDITGLVEETTEGGQDNG